MPCVIRIHLFSMESEEKLFFFLFKQNRDSWYMASESLTTHSEWNKKYDKIVLEHSLKKYIESTFQLQI